MTNCPLCRGYDLHGEVYPDATWIICKCGWRSQQWQGPPDPLRRKPKVDAKALDAYYKAERAGKTPRYGEHIDRFRKALTACSARGGMRASPDQAPRSAQADDTGHTRRG